MIRRSNGLLAGALCILFLTAAPAHAGLGWTLDQFKQQYGNPVLDQELIAGRLGYVFTGQDYIVAAFFHDTQVSRVLYICRGSSVFDWEKARALLTTNAPDATWGDASKNDADKSLRVDGTKDGVERYYASLTDDGQMLAIWTKEDDEAGKPKPELEKPLVSSLADSSGRGSSGGLAGHIPTESGSPPESNHSDGPVASASPSVEPPTSAPASRAKIARVKLRPARPHNDNHAANLGGKMRSTASSRQHVGGLPPAPAPTPLLMNAGTALYNSDYTQPFKNSKKSPSP